MESVSRYWESTQSNGDGLTRDDAEWFHKRQESWVSCARLHGPWEWGKRGRRDHGRSFATKLGTRWDWDLKLKDSLESEEHLPDSLTVLSSGLPGSASCCCQAKKQRDALREGLLGMEADRKEATADGLQSWG